MDVKARIEEVISQKGLTKREVSERMGKFNQAFNSLITNPKWDTIEHVAEAIGITTEELLFDRKPNTSKEEMDGTVLSADSKTIGMLVCPHCGKGISFKTEII